jgi:osmotically-inducible protein OsmY
MKTRLVLLLICPLLLTSCAGALVGAGATVGMAAASEGGLKRAVSDAEIQAEINRYWFEYDVETFAKLDLTVNQGRVLITGVVQIPKRVSRPCVSPGSRKASNRLLTRSVSPRVAA